MPSGSDDAHHHGKEDKGEEGLHVGFVVTIAFLELMFLILVCAVWMMEGNHDGACLFIAVMVWYNFILALSF